MKDTPLAVGCAVIAILSLVIQFAFLGAHNYLRRPSRQIRVFSQHDIIFQCINLAQLIVSIIILGIVASLVPDHKEESPLEPAIGYSLFPVLFSFLTLVSFLFAYGVPAFRRRRHIWTLNVANVLFILCAAISLSARLGNPVCILKADRAKSAILRSYAPEVQQSACHRVQAAAVFYFFLLGLYIATLVMAIELDDEEESPNHTRSSRRSDRTERRARRRSPSVESVRTRLPRSPLPSYQSTISSRSNQVVQQSSQDGGVTQYYHRTAVMNIMSGDGPPVTQHFHNSRVMNVVADESTMRTLGMGNRIPSNLLT